MLGGAALERDRVVLDGPSGQRKSLALLALLAVGDEAGMSRDRIMALLWPEAEGDKASHRLAQLLYALRRDLGADDLFLGTPELRLNSARVESDVAEFTRARREGQLAAAAAAYRGPFLQGFFLSGAVEFDDWMESERSVLARAFTETVEALAAEATMQGDQRRAAEWWRRLADEDPLSSRVTVHLMSALAAYGNRAGALDRARLYTERVRTELAAEPNPAVTALAQDLRQRPAQARLRSLETAVPEIMLAVLPFEAIGGGERLEVLAGGLVDELMVALGRVPGVRVAARVSASALDGAANADRDARAIGARLGVHGLVEGTVRGDSGRVRVSVRLVHAGDGCHLWSERYERAEADVFALQDELATLVARAVAEVTRTRDLAGLVHVPR